MSDSLDRYIMSDSLDRYIQEVIYSTGMQNYLYPIINPELLRTGVTEAQHIDLSFSIGTDFAERRPIGLLVGRRLTWM